MFEYHSSKFPTLFNTYKENPVEYSMNSDFFRSEFEFDPDESLKVDIFLGCSHTVGIGHHWEHTWPFLVSQKTGYKVVNLGIGGSGIEVSYGKLLKYIDYFDVQNIFHYQPIYARYDFIDNRDTSFADYLHFHYLPFQPQYDAIDTGYSPYTREYIRDVMVSDRYMYYNHVKHLHAVHGLASSRGIPYFYQGDFPRSGYNAGEKVKSGPVTRDSHNRMQWGIINIDELNLPKEDLLARDGIHFTKSQLSAIANEFIHMYSRDNSGYIQKTSYMEKIFPKNSP